MPAVTWVVGYFPARRLGLGDDIPAKVAMQWAGRFSSDVTPVAAGSEHDRTRQLLNRCAALERPAQLVSVSDDAFATVASATRLLSSYYPRLLPKQHIVVTPAEAGVRRLGHFGVFSRAAGALWPRLLALIDTRQL
jgi:predicted alpha/beta hydrolase